MAIRVENVIDRDRQVVQSLASLILEHDRHASIRIREARPRLVLERERSHGGRERTERGVVPGNWDGSGTLLNNYLRIDAVGPSRG